MTETLKDGGPAFPLPVADQECHGRFESGCGGISMRDYFAARAMQADLSNWPEDASDWLKYRDDLARRYYLMADAMLKAREA